MLFTFNIFVGSSRQHWVGVNFWDLMPIQLVKLGILVISVFAVSFGPFIAMVPYINGLITHQNIIKIPSKH